MEPVRRISLAGAAREPHTAQLSLVRASRQGDIDAYSRLFEWYRCALYQVCLRRLRNTVLAEDAVQETFLKAFENFSMFDTDRRVWPWLVTIADRTCIDLLRRQAKLSSIDEAEEPEALPCAAGRDADDTTLGAIIDAERRARLEQALGVLPPRQRRALMLFGVEGWTYSEIASVEGASRAAIKSVIWRARVTMRKAYEAGASDTHATHDAGHDFSPPPPSSRRSLGLYPVSRCVDHRRYADGTRWPPAGIAAMPPFRFVSDSRPARDRAGAVRLD